MSKMGYIHHLCEKGDRKGLIEELGSTEQADGFLRAHKEMRDKRESPAFKVLNKIVDESLKEVKKDVEQAKEESKEVKKDIALLFKDIERMN